MDLFLWLLKVNGVPSCPSTRSFNSFCGAIHTVYGIESVCHNEPLGHRYYVNSLTQILSQVRARLNSIHHVLIVAAPVGDEQPLGPTTSSFPLGRQWTSPLGSQTSVTLASRALA